MTAVLEVVAVGPAAAALLAALHAAAFCRPGDESWSVQAFDDVLRMPGAFCLLAQLTGPAGPEPVGFCACRVSGPDSELLSLGVVPAWRNRGTARRLIERGIERCREGGAEDMFLEVAEDNPVAQSLYRSLGFRQVGRRRGYYLRLEDRRVDALTLRRPLR
jgi:ribosomal-protein-alanine N-acetyltransferase